MASTLSLRPSVVAFYKGRRMPRGVRNNNPGNIRLGPQWLGLCDKQEDPSFCQFATVGYGLRAMAKLLKNYVERDGVRTVRDAVNRWAPPSENATQAYITDVCKRTGLSADHVLDISVDSTDIPRMIQALCEHECGAPLPYTATDYKNALILAGGAQ